MAERIRVSSILTNEQLEKLNTKRLLAYRDSLLKCWDHYAYDDQDKKKSGRDRLTKEDQEWKDVYKNVVDILNTREHVEKK
jgi:hypothetical protein